MKNLHQLAWDYQGLTMVTVVTLLGDVTMETKVCSLLQLNNRNGSSFNYNARNLVLSGSSCFCLICFQVCVKYHLSPDITIYSSVFSLLKALFNYV
jgi:hypothetical protein